MYLKAKKYVSGYSFCKDQEKSTYNALLKVLGLELSDIDESTPSAEIDFTVAYWRKANAIHNWFIQNCAGGEDDCRPVYVSREQLTELLENCKKAIAEFESGNKEMAGCILTPTPGFFFGGTDLDECYLEDLKSTVEQIGKVLNNTKFECWDFIYRASW